MKPCDIIDDCETLLGENKINPNYLLSNLNSINPSIQFTMEYSKDAIPFRDISIKRNNDKISIDIYYKPNDIHRCLPFSSNHPKHWHVVSAQLLKKLKQRQNI